MRSSVKLHPTRWDAAVAAVILLLAAVTGGAYWAGALSGGDGLQAVVSADGAEVDRVDLSALTAPESRTYANNGYSLLVEFSTEGVRVVEADCPNQDCVYTGEVRTAGRSVVCLPARISIQLTGGAADNAVDAVIG